MKKRVIILGAGPGGYVAALTAAQSDLDVTLVEERAVGGTCLNRGCIPTKALLASSELYTKIRQARKYGIAVGDATPDLPAMVERKNGVVKTLRAAVGGLLRKREVRIIAGRGRFLDARRIEAAGETLTADAVILATGSEVLRLWEGDGIITSDEALDLQAVPGAMLVVGAGAVGVEMACFFSEIGSKVTLVEMLPQVLPGADGEVAETLARELKKKGITVKTGCRIDALDGRSVRFSDGGAASYDAVLQAVGRRFNTEGLGLEEIGLAVERGRIATDAGMETAVPGVYAIGDVVAGSPMLAHVASAQGIVAALRIAGKDAAMDYGAVPGCVYSHPEAASVGAREQDVENAVTAKVPYRSLGRAHAGGEIAGLLKVVAEKSTGRVRGVHMVGEKATELIHEGVLAVKMGLTVRQLAEVIRAHPTFSELFSEAYHALEGRPVHTL